METTDLAYVAGFFDGEGYIGIARLHTGIGKYRGRYLMHQMHVRLCQNEPCQLLYDLQETYGGKVSRRHSKVGDKYAHLVWNIVSRSALVFLSDILPYLRLKKREAEVAFQFQETVGNRGTRIGDEVRAEREEIYEDMRAMKKKNWADGPYVIPD
jgi:hypothetical protein